MVLLGPEAAPFLADFHRAEENVRQGQPAALMEVALPLPYITTAAGYVEKYGPDERYNILSLLGGVSCPTLLTLGSLEVATNMAFRGLPKALAPIMARHPHLRVAVIEGADHFYANARDALATQLESWLRLIPPPV